MLTRPPRGKHRYCLCIHSFTLDGVYHPAVFSFFARVSDLKFFVSTVKHFGYDYCKVF